MKIKIKQDRSVCPKNLLIANKYENNTRVLEFDTTEISGEGNCYMFLIKEGNTIPFPLIDNTLNVDTVLTQNSGNYVCHYVISNKQINGALDLSNTLFISDAFILQVQNNQINASSLEHQPLPHELKIVYDDLLNLKKQLDNGLENGSFVGPKGEKGDPGNPGKNGTDGFSPIVSTEPIKNGTKVNIQDENGIKTFDVLNGEKGDPYENSPEFRQLAEQVHADSRKASESAGVAQASAQEAKTAEVNAKTSETKAKEYLNKISQSDNKMIGRSSAEKTAIVEDSYDDNVSIRLFGNATINEIKATGENLFPSNAQYDKPYPIYLKGNTDITITLKEGKQSLGGNLKAINEDGTERWLPIDKGLTAKHHKVHKNTKSIINLLSSDSNPDDFCLTIGNTEKHIPYQEKKVTLSAPITLRAVVNENGNVTIDSKRYLSDILLKKDGKYQIERNLSEENQPLEKANYEQVSLEDEKRIENLVSFNHYTTLTADGAHCEFEYTQNANIVKNSLIARILKLEAGGRTITN